MKTRVSEACFALQENHAAESCFTSPPQKLKRVGSAARSAESPVLRERGVPFCLPAGGLGLPGRVPFPAHCWDSLVPFITRVAEGKTAPVPGSQAFLWQEWMETNCDGFSVFEIFPFLLQGEAVLWERMCAALWVGSSLWKKPPGFFQPGEASLPQLKCC